MSLAFDQLLSYVRGVDPLLFAGGALVLYFAYLFAYHSDGSALGAQLGSWP